MICTLTDNYHVNILTEHLKVHYAKVIGIDPGCYVAVL
jgi:hypothetical protein